MTDSLSPHVGNQAGADSEPVPARSDTEAPVLLRVMRKGDDGTVEEATVVELATGDVIVSVDGQERPQHYRSGDDAIGAEEVLHRMDDRHTVVWSPVVPSWRLVDLLEGDYVEVNGAPWYFDGETWWPEDGYDDDPAYEDDVATAIFKVPGAGGMTGGPVSAIRLQRLGDRYWWHDWEREELDRTRASTPQQALEWFTGSLDGKIVDFDSHLLDGLDDDVIAELLPGNGPALWVNGNLWEHSDHRWGRRPIVPAGGVPSVDLRRAEVCELIGSESDAYRWLELTVSPVSLDETSDPSWWWLLVADAEPSPKLLAFLADAVFGSTEDPTPNHPPTVLAHLGDGTRWVGVRTEHGWVAEKLFATTPGAVRVSGNSDALWVVDADGQPCTASWGYEASPIRPPSDGDVIPLVDPTW